MHPLIGICALAWSRRRVKRGVERTLLLLTFAGLPEPTHAQSPATGTEAGLRRAVIAWQLAFEKGDVEAMGAAYAEGAYALYPRSGPVLGRQANRDAWARAYQRKGFRHPISIDSVFLSGQGDLGVVRGRWGYHSEDTSPPTDLGGEFLSVWVPDGAGRWLLHSLAANMYTPMPGTAPRR